MTKYVALLLGDHRTKIDDGIKHVNAGLEILQKKAKNVESPVFVHYDRKEILFSVVYEADKEIEVNDLLQKKMIGKEKQQEKVLPSSTVTKADEKEEKKAEDEKIVEGDEKTKEEEALKELEAEPAKE